MASITTCVRDMHPIRLPICLLGMSKSAEYDVYSRYVNLVLAELEPVTMILRQPQ